MSALVRFAGWDRNEHRLGYYQDRPSLYVRKREMRRALSMFRSGLDTLAIAAKLGCTEPRAQKLVTQARSQALGLPAPYEARS